MLCLKSPKSVFVLIFASSSAVGAAIIAAFAVAMYSMMEGDYRKNVERLLSDSARMVAEALNENVSPETLAEICRRYDEYSGVRTTIVGVDGAIVADSRAEKDSMSNHLNRAEIKRALSGETNFIVRYSNTLDAKMLYIAAPAGGKASGLYRYCVRQSVAMRDLVTAERIFSAEILALSAGAVLLAAAFSFMLARKISAPLKRLSAAASECAKGNFDAPVPDSGISEIRGLGESVSAMAENLKNRIESLHKRNCELDEIFEHMADCVFICTRDGFLKKYNKACAELFGLENPGEKLKVAEAFRNSALVSAAEEVFSAAGELRRDIEISPNKVYALVGSMLPYSSSNPRALFVMRDVSASKMNESLRREFVAGVSHELKTPITAIKMAAETLEYSNPEESKRFVSIIQKEADHMDTLVNDMLLLSKIEFTKKFGTENLETFPLRAAIDEAVSIHESEARRRNGSISVECPGDLKIKADFTLLQIAVSNLIGNAVKYGGDGVAVAISAKRDAAGRIVVSVSDTGPGIAPENLPRLFERFYRVDKGRSRAQGGTGLGLAIVKHVAALHGGDVFVRSAVGKGTEFSIVLGQRYD